MLGNDHWTLDLADLGMAEAGDELARTILRCRPPYAICVQGKWGSGKTSLMRYAMARLGGRPLAATLETSSRATSELPSDLDEQWQKLSGTEARVFLAETIRPRLGEPPPENLDDRLAAVPIWFNPWQHQSAAEPAVALLQEVRHQFTRWAKLLDESQKLLQISIEAGLSILGELTDLVSVAQGGPRFGLGKVFGGIRSKGEAYEARHFETVPDAQRIHLLFREAVHRLLGHGETDPTWPGRAGDGLEGEPVALRRLVIFVDDLDRCADEQTVRLLEAIKLYLQTPNCVFVFGMDGAAARRAVRKVHAQGDEIAREYLEKLFQTAIQVPLPLAPETFVRKLLAHHELDEAKTGVAIDELADAIVALVEPNPRKLKNFVNSLAAGWRTCGREESTQFRDFLLLAHLRAYHADVYRLISYDPQHVRVLARVLQGRMPDLSSPVAYFFYLAFRHAFPEMVDDEGRTLDAADFREAVADLVERLDRHKGDQAFLALWKTQFGEGVFDEAVERLRPLLARLPSPDPGAPSPTIDGTTAGRSAARATASDASVSDASSPDVDPPGSREGEEEP